MKNFKINLASVCHLLIISAVGALVYSNTLTSAFQFDDKLNIVDNPFIRDISNLWPPVGPRWFGLLTFSLNYMAGGVNPFGYHLVNIGIHILTALSVYLLVLLTLRTPYFKGHTTRVIPDEWFACACALLFVAHPIQTQAVTYIVQRFASLATLLYLLSLDTYILARLIAEDRATASPAPGRFLPHRTALLLYAAAVFFALLSLKTKEIAFTLPVVALMYDVLFISGLSQLLATIRKQWRVAASLSGLALVFFAVIINRYGLFALLDKFKATNEISRHDYLVTQFRVIVTYIRLLFVPVNQTIDHHYRVYRSLSEPEVIASLAVIAFLIGLAVYLYRVPRDGSPYLRLVSFGIFWFFMTLSIESSIIPIIDVMFEHRLYLPSIGMILAVTAAIVHTLEKTLNSRQARRSAACLLATAVIALSCTAYVRNGAWKTELTLWSDVIAKAPLNPRGYNMVGSYYQVNFRIHDAIGYFRKALEVDSSYAEARSNLGNAYIQIGRIDEGLNELMITARNNRFDQIDAGILYYNIAKGFQRKGMPDAAIENLKIAQRLIPNEAGVYFLLGEAYQRTNQPEQSSAYFKKAHELDPGRY